jgi:hypothetical protein
VVKRKPAVDGAGTADYIAAQFAGVNADARRIMQVTAEAIAVSTERQASAQKRADEAAAAAEKVFDSAKANEKKLSPRIADLIKEVPGATAAGSNFSLKTLDSLRRKVAGLHKRNGDLTPEELLGGMKDNVRYTMTFSFDDYVAGVKAAMAIMAKKYTLDHKGFKNSWADPHKDYRGINSVWLDPSTGQRFEMQFHTMKSFEVNKAEHVYYERWRVMEAQGADPAEIAAVQAISKAMWGDVHMPLGADALSY